MHDLAGNLIAEIDGTTGWTLREYIWLPDDEIAPTRETAGTPVARPLAVVNVPAGTTHMVHVDHLNRPVMMTDAGKAEVWKATYLVACEESGFFRPGGYVPGFAGTGWRPG